MKLTNLIYNLPQLIDQLSVDEKSVDEMSVDEFSSHQLIITNRLKAWKNFKAKLNLKRKREKSEASLEEVMG